MKKKESMYIFDNKVVMFTAYVVTGERDCLFLADKMTRILGENDKILSGFHRCPIAAAML